MCLILVSCKQGKQEKDTLPIHSDILTKSRYLIEAEELVPLLDSKNIKVIDFRRKASFVQGHIPGAINFWRADIENSDYPYSGMKADAIQLEELFSSLGIENGDLLVAYDDVGSCDAARLWWVLQFHGFENLKILNGGLDAWEKIKGAVTTEKTKISPSNFQLPSAQNTSIRISNEELKLEMTDSNPALLLDNRTYDEFTGKRQKKGAIATGHIPSSIHIDWAENVNYDGNKKFKSVEALAEMYQSLGLSKDQKIVTYCHSGVRSSLTYFVLTELLAYEDVRNYDGSWLEWSHLRLPFEQDSVTVNLN